MHPSNPYAACRPDFASLARDNPQLAPFVNTAGPEPVIDFSDTSALRALTAALLKSDFQLDVQLRDDRLCPTIANRLDYILTCLDLPAPGPLRALDVGTGHVAIYPLLLHRLRPDAAAYGSELDPTSLAHAHGVLQANNVPEIPLERTSPSSRLSPGATSGGITLLPACADGASLLAHRIYPLSFTMCNPPFFASAAEVELARAGKAGPAPAGPTCSPNEEVTRGGEAAFISQLVDESVMHKAECHWFTSLVGRYATLETVVGKVREVTRNYAVVRLQQANTVRWVLAWSFGPWRLPDEQTRPRHLDSSTSFARLLPLPNTFTFHSALTVDELRAAVETVLENVQLLPRRLGAKPEATVSSGDHAAVGEEHAASVSRHDMQGESTEVKTREAGTNQKLREDSVKKDSSIALAPISNTWSRSARRAAAASTSVISTAASRTTHSALAGPANEKHGAQGAGQPSPSPAPELERESLFRATLKFTTAPVSGSSEASTSTTPTAAEPTTAPVSSTAFGPSAETSSHTLQTDLSAPLDPDTDSSPRCPGPQRSGSRLSLHWTYGADRAPVDAFWKFIVAKVLTQTGTGKSAGGESGSRSREGERGKGKGKRTSEAEAEEYGGRRRPGPNAGGGRGGRGRGGRGRAKGRERGSDGGWVGRGGHTA